MRAVVCQKGELRVEDVPTPVPAKGHLLLDVLRCGICGSDLHAKGNCDELAEVTAEIGYERMMRSDEPVIMGHEYVGEVAEVAPGTRTSLRAGARVVAMPLLRRDGAVHPIGLSADAPGAYAEQLLVDAALALPVPNGLATDVAALTEPMAVGLHAVRRSEIGKGDVGVVIGCGPVGLAVIGMLKARGVRTVVASDFSAGRRSLAAACGADVVVDPAAVSPFASAREFGHLVTAPEVFDLAVGTMEKLRRLPLIDWRHIWRAAELTGAATPKRPVIFECVGVPGMIDRVITEAPLFSRVVVVGVCMQPDRIRPVMAINKEIDLRFVLGYTPLEFRDSLYLLADGKVDARPVVTGCVGLDGVADAFLALGDADRHAKILIDPRSNRTDPDAA